MEAKERQKLALWYTFCVLVALSGPLLPFLWRTEVSAFLMIGFCIAPCLAPVALAFILLTPLHKGLPKPLHIVLGCVIGAAGIPGWALDEFARERIFQINYREYREEVRTHLLAKNPAKELETVKLTVRGIGVYGAEAVRWREKEIISIETISGPTVEEVLFSISPVDREPHGRPLRLVLRDDLGYWYFVGWLSETPATD